MKKVFVFITNKENLTESPIYIANEILFGFDESPIVGISSNKKPINLNETPYFLFIKDDITLQEPAENGNEQGNSLELAKILSDIDEIYLTIHKTKPSNYLETFLRLFKGKLISYIYHSHETDSIFFRILKPALNDDSIDDLTKIEQSILLELPNKRLESLIHLNKLLKIIPIKCQDNWDENSFKLEFSKIIGLEEIKLAKDKLENITFKSDINDYLDQLKDIESEITNLSINK